MAPVAWHEAHALRAHPLHGLEALGDEKLYQVRIGAELGHLVHVVEEDVCRVSPEVGRLDLRLGELDERLEVLQPVVGEAHGARGEAAVAAGFLFRRALQHRHLGARLLGCESGAQRRVAGADDDHVVVGLHHKGPLVGRRPANLYTNTYALQWGGTLADC